MNYLYRKKVLFNLYGLSEHNTLTNASPELHLVNCDFEYFMNYYESLINVQSESLTKGTAKVLTYNSETEVSYDDYYEYYTVSSFFTKSNKDFYFS
jgi:hypothetical protein